MCQEKDAALLEPMIRFRRESVENRQAGMNFIPERWRDNGPFKDASIPPGAQGPHALADFATAGARTQTTADHADDHGQQRDGNDGDNQHGQVLLDERHIAKEVT